VPAFPKPTFKYDYDPQDEIKALRAHKAVRGIPKRASDRLLVCTWNIANFGAQQRRTEDRQLISEIISWFDVVAIQELKDNFADLVEVKRLLGKDWHILFSDACGNDERMAFVYDHTRVKLQEKVGEIAYSVAELKNVKLAGIKQPFQGFDRTPYLASFHVDTFTFLLVNVHLYFGKQSTTKDKKASMERRTLETFAVAKWAEKRKKSPYAYVRDVIALGDFNMPKRDPQDPIFKALSSKGLHVPEHTSKVGSNLAGDADYDQIAFFPDETEGAFTGLHGVFDFDNAVFKDLWNDGKGEKRFRQFVKYYMSDHRPMWMQFNTAV